MSSARRGIYPRGNRDRGDASFGQNRQPPYLVAQNALSPRVRGTGTSYHSLQTIAQPPLSVPGTSYRYTIQAIRQQGSFGVHVITVNIIRQTQIRETLSLCVYALHIKLSILPDDIQHTPSDRAECSS